MMTAVNAETPNVLLSILIPTYNRASRVRALLLYLSSAISEADCRFEIIVSNNCSSDDTATAIGQFSRSNIRIVNRQIHLASAEEHVFEAIKECRGEYIWVHGDDDICNLETFDFAVELLQTRAHDFIVFNSQFVNGEGRITGGWLAYMHSDIVQENFVKSVCALGLTSNFAGFSNAIMRRHPLTVVDAKHLMQQSLIYSHVAWWLLAFQQTKMTIVNRPLVAYRVNDEVEIFGHFKKVAERFGVADFYFWTFGLKRLLAFLESKGVLKKRDIAQIFEFGRDGGSFRLFDNMLHLLSRQVLVSGESVEERNKISKSDLDEMSDWIMGIDPGYFELIEVVKRMYEATKAKDGVTSSSTRHLDAITALKLEFSRLNDSRIIFNNPFLGLIGRRSHYLIFRHLRGCVAFDERRDIDRERYLRAVDFLPTNPSVIFNRTLKDLYTSIDHASNKERRLALSRQSDLFSDHQEVFSAKQLQGPLLRNKRLQKSYLTRKLPARLELEIGKLLCTLGIAKVGSAIYNQAVARTELSKPNMKQPGQVQ